MSDFNEMAENLKKVTKYYDPSDGKQKDDRRVAFFSYVENDRRKK